MTQRAMVWLMFATTFGCAEPGTSGGTRTNTDGGADTRPEDTMAPLPDGQLCVPLERFCGNQDLFVCDADGAGATLVESCATNGRCDSETLACVCVPACDGRECGTDGCGGQCGACDGDDACEDGRCADQCEPYDCGIDPVSGKDCGSCAGATVVCQHNYCTDPCEAGHCDQCTTPIDHALADDPLAYNVVAQCATECIDRTNVGACATGCVARETGASEPCSGCFGRYAACIVRNCLEPCTFVEVVTCEACRATHCDPAFNLCLGD